MNGHDYITASNERDEKKLKEMHELLHAHGYHAIKLLPSGQLAAILPMAFTFALCVGLDKHGYRTRYCYEKAEDALAAIVSWSGSGDPPGPWIKQKPEERLGPGATQ